MAKLNDLCISEKKRAILDKRGNVLCLFCEKNLAKVSEYGMIRKCTKCSKLTFGPMVSMDEPGGRKSYQQNKYLTDNDIIQYMTSPKHAGGRPLIFKSVKEVEDKIEEYFDYCDNRLVNGYDNKTNEQFAYINPEPYTMSGLAYYLGIDRKTVINYSNKDEFFHTIKRAREKVEMDIERRMNDKNTFTPGLIFNAKNNFDWKDKTEVDQNIRVPKPLLNAIHNHSGNEEVAETEEEN